MFRVNVVKARPDLSVHCGEGLLYLIILGVLHGTVWWREDAQCGDNQRGRGGGGAGRTHTVAPRHRDPGPLLTCWCCVVAAAAAAVVTPSPASRWSRLGLGWRWRGRDFIHPRSWRRHAASPRLCSCNQSRTSWYPGTSPSPVCSIPSPAHGGYTQELLSLDLSMEIDFRSSYEISNVRCQPVPHQLIFGHRTIGR